MTWWVVGGVIVGVFVLFAVCACVVAGRADDAAEEIMRKGTGGVTVKPFMGTHAAVEEDGTRLYPGVDYGFLQGGKEGRDAS